MTTQKLKSQITPHEQADSTQTPFHDLEVAAHEYKKAYAMYIAAQAKVFEYIKTSDPYCVNRLRQWDNRCEFPGDF